MKQRKFRPKQLSFRAALLLFCLLLATLGMAVGLHARYTSSAAASDGARVAKFEITEEGLGAVEQLDVLITADLVPGEIHPKTLTIQNKSEVAVEYTITVKNLTGNLPLQFKVAEMGTTAAEGEYSCSARLEPNETEANTYTLQIIWPTETAEDQDYQDPKFVGMVDQVKVSISAVQID